MVAAMVTAVTAVTAVGNAVAVERGDSWPCFR